MLRLREQAIEQYTVTTHGSHVHRFPDSAYLSDLRPKQLPGGPTPVSLVGYGWSQVSPWCKQGNNEGSCRIVRGLHPVVDVGRELPETLERPGCCALYGLAMESLSACGSRLICDEWRPLGLYTKKAALKKKLPVCVLMPGQGVYAGGSQKHRATMCTAPHP